MFASIVTMPANTPIVTVPMPTMTRKTSSTQGVQCNLVLLDKMKKEKEKLAAQRQRGTQTIGTGKSVGVQTGRKVAGTATQVAPETKVKGVQAELNKPGNSSYFISTKLWRG